VPNPDFEDSIAGWPSRGWQVERCLEVKHSGAASLHISGELSGANETVNTVYNTSGSPYEITWLEPGTTYRLTAWVRVDRLSPGAPPPSVRIALRDAAGTRAAVATPKYDLTRKGTWQALSVEVKIPVWNTRNYIAVNTNTIEKMNLDMYLDDISLIPADLATGDTYAFLRLDPEKAERTGALAVRPYRRFNLRNALLGKGDAHWTIRPWLSGQYTVWLRLDRAAGFDRLVIDGKTVAGPFRAAGLGWHRLGRVALQPGKRQVVLKNIHAGATGRLVLTTDPTR
jgi:hypothetical protein